MLELPKSYTISSQIEISSSNKMIHYVINLLLNKGNADIATNTHVIFSLQNQHRKSLFRKLTLKSDGLGKTKS
ncbi:MAG: hypothetical protein K2J04_05970 [Lachnospiraceae bacterium]|nr:hypothetical protein [Lachnospiraceae bacterium]